MELKAELHTRWRSTILTMLVPLAVESLAGGAVAQDLPPVCRNGQRDIALPSSGEEVTVTVEASDDVALASVDLLVDVGEGFVPQSMADDGLHGDGVAGDAVFGARIAPQPAAALVRYYARATDGFGRTDMWPNNAPAEYRAYTVDHVLPQLRVTEVLAKNDTGIEDEFDERNDWIEIYNACDTSVQLGGMYLTDDFDQTHKWELPSRLLGPGGFLIVWADGEPEQGPWHATFKLSTEGESVGLYETEDHGNVRIHGFRFGRMSADVSVGYRRPQDTAPEYLATPTPGASNTGTPPFSPVCINEFQTTSSFGGADDWVELYNRGDEPVDIGGWLLSDDRFHNARWAFPAGTRIDPGGYLVVYQDAFLFGWGSEGGEVIMLTAADSLTGQDFYDIGPQSPDITEGRCPDGLGRWQFFTPPTPGTRNCDLIPEVEGVPGVWWPNPFVHETRLLLALRGAGQNEVTLYSVAGRCVCKLQAVPAGADSLVVAWDGRDDAGRPLPSGVYYTHVESMRVRVRPLVLVR